MKRNSTILFLESLGATTGIPWIDNAPDFSGFTDPTLTVLTNSWQAFLDTGEQLQVIPDPEPEPLPPIPDWAGFNLAMVPPSSQSSFEAWLSQFKPAYQTAVTVPAALGQLSQTQSGYDTLKSLSPPTAEQVVEWQGIADQFNIGISF